jgi:hypothetical protein
VTALGGVCSLLSNAQHLYGVREREREARAGTS